MIAAGVDVGRGRRVADAERRRRGPAPPGWEAGADARGRRNGRRDAEAQPAWRLGTSCGRDRGTAAAVVITAATSYGEPIRVDELAGTPFLLTPEDPVARVPVTFGATPEAFEGDPDVSLVVLRSVVWEAVDHADERIEVELVPHDPADDSRSIVPCGPGECVTWCSGPACATSYDLVFRWPEHVQEGAARVEWSLEGSFSWISDGGFLTSGRYPLDGTELTLEVGELTGGATPPTVVASWETAVDPHAAVIREEVTVATSEPLDGGVLAFEPQFDAEALRVALPHGWGVGDPPIHLDTASSLPIPVPERCHDAPCTFSFDTLVQVVRTDPAIGYRWRLPTVEWAIATTAPLGVEVARARASVPEVTTRAQLGRFVLDGEDASDAVRLVITLPPTVLSADEWPPGLADTVHAEDTPNRPAREGPAAGAGPAVTLELRPAVVTMAGGEPDPPPDLELHVLVDPDTNPYAGARSGIVSESGTPPSQWGPWRTALSNDCLPDRPCEIVLEVRTVATYGDPPQGDPVVAFDLDAEVAVLLPWTTPAPSSSPTVRLVP